MLAVLMFRGDMVDQLVEVISTSVVREYVLWALMNIPGLPPVAQAIHIMGIAVVVASIMMIALRFLNIAVPSQSPTEMISRLMPWLWCALLVMLMTGVIFIIARPDRYFYNPIVVWKFSFLSGGLLLAMALHAMNMYQNGFWESSDRRLIAARVLSVLTILSWLGVIFAGRWIAYLDYIYY